MSEHLDGVRQAQGQGLLLQTALDNIELWLNDLVYAEFEPQVAALIQAGRWSELNDCFYTQIPFGTGGRRGTEGVGPNRINDRTIGESAAGLAMFLAEQGRSAAERGVVVAYDTRRNSKRYAELCAEVLAAAGITTHLFAEFRPTPVLSFAVRQLGAAAGVVITASHNPPPDNGFKAYGADGGQVVPPDDGMITECVERVERIERLPLTRALEQGLVRLIGPEIDRAYLQRVCELSLTDARELDFVYTPLHGVGATAVVPALEMLGFKGLRLFELQAVPDPEFSSVPGGKPNPEERESMGLAVQYATQQGADLVLASDPDADRLGVVAFERGTWNYLSGNQVGALLCWFVLDRLAALGRLRRDGLVIETLVSTDLVARIARSYKLEVIDDLLVGFKWIAATIQNLNDQSRFVFAFEESLGYLAGDFVRDKDAVIAAMLLAQCAAHLRREGRGLLDQLDALMLQHGVFVERQKSIFLEGAEGSAKMQRIMAALRVDPPHELAGLAVVAVTDRRGPTRLRLDGSAPQPLACQPGDVLVFHLSDDLSDRITVRPSGTEPKIKHYAQFSTRVGPGESIEAGRELMQQRCLAVLDALLALETRLAES